MVYNVLNFTWNQQVPLTLYAWKKRAQLVNISAKYFHTNILCSMSKNYAF